MSRTRLELELERHHVDAWRWALSCCDGNADRAGDVLQDAYLRILDGRADFGGRSRFRTWLFGVIRQVTREHQRRGRRDADLMRRAGDGRFGNRSDASEGADPAAELERVETARRLREALERLPERQRAVMHLVFDHGCSIAEAAEVLEIAVGTARTHYERAKKRLRRDLSEAWVK